MELKIKSSPLKVTHNYPFRFGIISDLQVGCQFGLFPPSMDNSQNIGFEGRKILWKYLNDFIKQMKKNKIETLLVVGDLVAGQNWAELGKYLITSGLQMDPQEDACAEILRYICKGVPTINNVYLWKGTPYHGRPDHSVEKAIATRLKTLMPKLNVMYTGEYSYLTIEYKGRKKTLWVAHPSTSAIVYPETALGRDIMFFHDSYAQGKIPKVDVIIRAHGHYSMELHKAQVRYIMLPCWQFFVPYDKAVKYYPKFQPDIGGYIVMFDEELRMVAWHFLYSNIPNPKQFLNITSTYGVNHKCLSKK